MEDLFMKMGMLIVAVAVISIMIAFVFKSANTVPINPKSYEQELAGDSDNIGFAIDKLCEECLADQTNRDCYLLNIKLESGTLTQDWFAESVQLTEDLNPGSHTVKLANKDAVCEVRKLG